MQADMVTIPSGSFRMGYRSISNRNEIPVHTVQVSSFRMAKFEVTIAQWMVVMGDKPGNVLSSGMNYPVENVSWDDIQIFLGKLNKLSGKTFRLPSEAEWEYAARAGTTAALSIVGEYRDGSLPVGSFQPNAFGLYDMHGNVKEWVQDCWNYDYNGAPTDGSAWLSGRCVWRVMRGDSWSYTWGRYWGNSKGEILLLHRRSSHASRRYYDLGFRLAQN